MAIDFEAQMLTLKMLDVFRCCFSESELKREAEAMFAKHKLKFKLALISRPRFSAAI